MVKKFEQEWSEWLGCKHSLFVSSGSTANLLLIAAIKEKYNLKDGDKVIVPAMTWVTNISPIMQLGLQPIFCDVNPNDFSFNKEHLKTLSITHHDIKAKFIRKVVPGDILDLKVNLVKFKLNNAIIKGEALVNN